MGKQCSQLTELDRIDDLGGSRALFVDATKMTAEDDPADRHHPHQRTAQAERQRKVDHRVVVGAREGVGEPRHEVSTPGGGVGPLQGETFMLHGVQSFEQLGPEREGKATVADLQRSSASSSSGQPDPPSDMCGRYAREPAGDLPAGRSATSRAFLRDQCGERTLFDPQSCQGRPKVVT